MPADLTIVIIGGVAGGASAATRARRMNEHANIIVLEKDEYVSFANCGLPYYIGDEITQRGRLLVATPELLARRFRLDVRTRQEVQQIDRGQKCLRVLNHKTGTTYDQPYDRLILSPGDELRDRINELDPQRATVVSCASGLRAHVAVRILSQRGFRHVKNLSGGATMRIRALATHAAG